MDQKIELKFYMVQNQAGRYFRAKGFGGHGDHWVDDPKKARVYSKPGPARSQVTYYAKRYPEFGIPKILELTVSSVTVLDEDERLIKAKKSMEIKRIKADNLRIRIKREQLEYEQEELNKKKAALGIK